MHMEDIKKPQPKYRQLKEAILRILSDERYAADQKIPTEEALISQFQVSRGTVRQAIAELESEGVLYKIQGSGTFFSGNMPDAPISNALIGVLTPRIDTYIFPKIIQGITDVAEEKGYHIMLGISPRNPTEEFDCIEKLLAKGIDGLLIDPPFNVAVGAAFLEFLKTMTIPVVLMDVMVDQPELSYVSLDDVEGGFKATSYLIEAGHRRIACIYPTNRLSGAHRHQGYRKALEAHAIAHDDRLEKAIPTETKTEPSAQTQPKHPHIPVLVQELLDLGDERPTAIVFYNDGMAVRGYQHLEAAGLRVPEDISIISFDDSDLALQPNVHLTSVIHPKYYLGKWAAELILDQIAHPGQYFPRHLLIAPTLAIRDSVRTIAD